MGNEGNSGEAAAAVVNRGHRVGRLLDRVPTLDHEHHWEGEFKGSHGAAEGSTIAIKARLAFRGELIDGNGRIVDGMSEKLDGPDSFTVGGTLDGDVVDLLLWFDAPLLGRSPFVGSGLLTSDAREIDGDWTVGCFNPATCGCDGGGGTFRLKRID